jgi:hypothetical protein
MPAPQLENRLPDEGINTSDEHPLREFAWLLMAGLVTFGLLLGLLSWSTGWLAGTQDSFSLRASLGAAAQAGR